MASDGRWISISNPSALAGRFYLLAFVQEVINPEICCTLDHLQDSNVGIQSIQDTGDFFDCVSGNLAV
jgi:hypothetical protein